MLRLKIIVKVDGKVESHQKEYLRNLEGILESIVKVGVKGSK